MRTLFTTAAAAALSLCLAAPSAQAMILHVDFTAGDPPTNPWFQVTGSGSPYGLPAQPVIVGSVDFDTSMSGAAAVTALDYVTGSRTWTPADLDANTRASFFGNGALMDLYLEFGDAHNYLAPGTAQISDGTDDIACNSCVEFRGFPAAPVPEPGIWTMLILGLGLMGTALRLSSPSRWSSAGRGIPAPTAPARR